MTLALLWQNKRIIGELIGLIIICFVAWWFFWHNPQKIDALERDKAELSRQVQEGQKAMTLLQDIEKGKAGINRETFKNISTIRAAAVPRRTIIIHGGVPLQTVH